MINRVIGMSLSLLLTACGGGGSSGGTPPPPAPPAPPAADTIRPETAVTGAPLPLANSTSATFVFTASERATFDGRLDVNAGGSYHSVTSPHTVDNLAEGPHTFEVYARDAAGNLDETPVVISWVVDSVAPDTQISSAPPSTGTVVAASFTVTTEAGASLEASLDGAPFGVVTSPYTTAGVTDGVHTIRFRARDAAGNVDATPAAASWTVDAQPTQVALQFPTRNFYTDAATVTVRGTAQDPNGVTRLTVNGVAAQTTDTFAHWKAVIPVPAGTSPVDVTAVDGSGKTQVIAIATMANRGTVLNSPRGVAYDAARDRIVIVDQAADSIVALRRSDGVVQTISPGSAPGALPGSGLFDVQVDAINDRALVLDSVNDELIAVDLASGDRSVVSASGGAGATTRVRDAVYFALDGAGQRAYVAVGTTGSIVRIELGTGARSIVSSAVVGSGDALVSPRGIVYDDVSNPAAPRLLVVSAVFGQGGVIAVDLATGNRSRFSIGSTGSGISFLGPGAMVMDAFGQRVIVSDIFGDLIAASLATGDRTAIRAPSPPEFFASYGGYFGFDPAARRLFATNLAKGVAEVDVITGVPRLFAGSGIGISSVYSVDLGLSIEPPSGAPARLVAVEGAFGILSQLDLAVSTRTDISAESVGSGPPLKAARDMLLDRRPAGNRSALVLVGQPLGTSQIPSLVSVDLANGNRTLVANVVSGSYDNPRNMALDVAGNRIVFTNDEISPALTDGLYALDLTTGAVSTISSTMHPGPAIAKAGHVVLEPAVNPTRAFVNDLAQPRILEIDLATGVRSVFAPLLDGHGGPLFVDSARSRLFVTNGAAPSYLMTVPLAFDGSSRQIISGSDPLAGPLGVIRGTGPPQYEVSSLAVDLANEVAYVGNGGNQSIMAIDIQSGDRVIVAR